jgi:hypothetical protein
MSKNLLLLAFLVMNASPMLHAEDPMDPWDIADREVKRLPPTAFRELPKSISNELQARQRMIPQPAEADALSNVIHGELARRGRTDWAVLCSRDRLSSILIFWGGAAKNVSEIAKVPDKAMLQGIGYGRIGYSRAINVVGEKYIVDHYRAYGGPRPPPIDHSGIDDADLGKVSVVLYYSKGEWLRLQGAD